MFQQTKSIFSKFYSVYKADLISLGTRLILNKEAFIYHF